jgi:hypothetical protein
VKEFRFPRELFGALISIAIVVAVAYIALTAHHFEVQWSKDRTAVVIEK